MILAAWAPNPVGFVCLLIFAVVVTVDVIRGRV